MTLFDFESPSDAWRVVNDGVMGGLSKGAFTITDGILAFTGTLVTQGGGFTSVRAQKRVDLSAYAGIELRVRGGGRTFELDVGDGTRQVFREVSRRAAFPTSPDWQTIRIPFSSLQTSVYGRPVKTKPLNQARIESLSLFIVDQKDGPFHLDVDWIRAYSSDEPANHQLETGSSRIEA
ncbi:MAG: CIA30 family protein [Bacteroidota bacterium]